MRDVERLIIGLRPHWSDLAYVEIALTHFVKAFFSAGLQELMDHIVVLEALLSDAGKIQDSIARRMSIILGTTERERESLERRFKKLYAFRSNLVHGKRFEQAVYAGHLRDARDMARRTLLWFLQYLGQLVSSERECDFLRRDLSRSSVLLTLVK